MAVIPLRQFGMLGIMPDSPQYDLPLNALTACFNMRIQDRKLQRTKGWTVALDLTIDFTDVFLTYTHPFYVVPVFGTDQGIVIIASDDVVPNGAVKFFFYNGITVVDISPAVAKTGTKWQWDSINNGLIINDGQSTPLIWTVGTPAFQELANFPLDTTVEVIKKYKEFYVGINVTEVGETFKTKVIWSNVIDPTNNDPDWGFADTTSLAGFNFLDDDPRGLVDMLDLNDQMFIMSVGKVFSMQFTGDQFVMRFRTAIEDGGMGAQGCVVNLENYQMALSLDDIYIHDGNTKKSIAVNRVRDDLFSRLSNIQNIKFYKNPIDNEIMICFQQDPATSFTFAMVYSFDYDTYTLIEMPEINDYAVGIDFTLIEGAQTWDTVTPVGLPWDVSTDTWGNLSGVSGELRPYTASPANEKIYLMDNTWLQEGFEYPSWIQRDYIDFDEQLGGAYTIKSLQKMWPQFDGEGIIRTQFGATPFPNGVISYDSVWDYELNVEDEVDIRTTGRYISYKFLKEGGGFWGATGIDLQLRPQGLR